MRVEAITGLSKEQVAELTGRVTRHPGTGDPARPRGRPCALDLYRSIVLVVHLSRKNPAQDVAAAFYNVSQATVSRRRDLPRPIPAARARRPGRTHPSPHRTPRHRTGRRHRLPHPGPEATPHLYPTKAGHPGTNVQTACDPGGAIAAIGLDPEPDARHDAHAHAHDASGLKDTPAEPHT